jgi:endonuclease/exonuclease/phosphatase family metal-dependent hydrolase
MKPAENTLRVATWNIHKGVRGLGPRRRLEIHDMVHAVEQFDADIVCLQEVRSVNRKEANYFTRWPELPQADYLAPEGYEVVYRTNAHTRHGEHGNALLSRWPVIAHQHEDMSDHRFEQRGLLHCEVLVRDTPVHVLVVHLGLIAASRRRQLVQLTQFIAREIPHGVPTIVAGDFNSPAAPVRWAQAHLHSTAAKAAQPSHHPTFPSRLPLVQLDHVFARHMVAQASHVPRGAVWARMSDHLPLLVDFAL